MCGEIQFFHFPSRPSLTAMAAFAVAMVIGLTALWSQSAPAQTFKVIYNFTGAADGADPNAPLVLDNAGNLYGTASNGGYTGGNCGEYGCGTVFKLANHGADWVLNTLYTFQGEPDGAVPEAGLAFGPDGVLYGTTRWGGSTGECNQSIGCGTAFNLRPPATACKTALCPWAETVLHRFGTQSGDGFNPTGIVFDQVGELYGITQAGGTGPCGPYGGGYYGCGTVYALAPSSGGWEEQVLYSFLGQPDGYAPNPGIVLDQIGNLYGTTYLGGDGYPGDGIVFQLTPSGSGWMENILHTFTDGADGHWPVANLVFDDSGNLYGASQAASGGGPIFMLSPQGSSWTFSVLYSLSAGSAVSLTIDAAGNLYGAGGPGAYGSVFKLTRSANGWTLTDLYEFTNGSDGRYPGGVTLDANGNLWGTASGGASGYGVVFEITP